MMLLGLILLSGSFLKAQKTHPLALVIDHQDAAKNQVIMVTHIKQITFSEGKMKVENWGGWPQKDNGISDIVQIKECRFSTEFATTGNKEIKDTKAWTLFEEDGKLQIRGLENGTIYTLKIYATDGKLLVNDTAFAGTPINVAHWAKGMYIVHINGKTIKFVR